MKKTLLLLLAINATISCANQIDDDLNTKRLAWSKKYLENQGLPSPDGGVKIISEKQMSSYHEKKEERLKFKKDIEQLGYINSDNPSTNQLLTLSITSQRDLIAHGNDNDPESTHLKKSVSDLKMAYNPIQVNSSVVDNYIGAAPYLTYLKDKGWVGVIQFFNNKKVGNCSFSENNIKLSHGSIIIAKEDVRHDVNDKVTTIEVMGTENGGFTYTVEWFDDAFFRKVECANKEFSTQTMDEVVKIAQSIDNS